MATNSTLLASLIIVVAGAITVEGFAPFRAIVARGAQEQRWRQFTNASIVQATSYHIPDRNQDEKQRDFQDMARQHLQRAKMLRQEAEEALADLEAQRMRRKIQRDRSADELIEFYFFGVDEYTSTCSADDALLNRLRDRRLGVTKLLLIVDRIFERLTFANKKGDRRTDRDVQLFRHANIDYDDDENRLDGCIEALIDLHEVLGEEFHRKQPSHEQASSHDRIAKLTEERYGSDKVARQLRKRIQQLRQEGQHDMFVLTDTEGLGGLDHRDILRRMNVSAPAASAATTTTGPSYHGVKTSARPGKLSLQTIKSAEGHVSERF